jgi:isopentenyl-diphosphate delta-isomerase
VTPREAHLVELVDADGEPRGSATVAEAHTLPGDLHRAFSVVLIDPAGRLLLQRRARTKTRFAGRWANACCGHPAPGVPVTEAATVRLREELGIDPVDLRDVGVYVYRAVDPASDRVEHEYDHVLVGSLASDVKFDPDPAEVDALRWSGLTDVRDDLATTPDAFAPWLHGVISTLPDTIARTRSE